jgi:purine-cytosine permease-like protein
MPPINRHLQISFCGYKILNWYERLAWLPVLIVFVVALGVGGKHLVDPPPAEPATAAVVLSFASTIAGFVITYAPLSSDFTSYFYPGVSRYATPSTSTYLTNRRYSTKIFLYSYIGFLLPIVSSPCAEA